MATTILIVDDESSTRALLRIPLEHEGFRVVEADTVQMGARLFGAEKPDLAVLDVELPDGTGYELCASIRKHPELSSTPVIMLTGKRLSLAEKELGFQSGADHYLIKPVALAELVLWVRSLLRRLELDKGEGDVLCAGDLDINVKAHWVRHRGQLIANLTRKELELLYCLVKKRPAALSRKYILSNLWHTVAVDRLVDAHISNLRKKLPQAVADRIQSVPGKGYRFLD
ncbi:MAG: response regulator transcription factor [Elusimicrobia bacterium]|nr:response regulator transcription factor [Elusimicrobiota bacterium]